MNSRMIFEWWIFHLFTFFSYSLQENCLKSLEPLNNFIQNLFANKTLEKPKPKDPQPVDLTYLVTPKHKPDVLTAQY